MPVALVTGAAVRVGRAIAEALADAGYDLVLHANSSREALEQVAAELRARGRLVRTVMGDLSTAEGTEAVVSFVADTTPVLDVLVNNAAVLEYVPFEKISRAQYRRVLDINLEAAFFLTQGMLEALKRASTPCVVNIADAAVERPYNHCAHYMVSKAGLVMLTKALALELAPRVRVNAVAPGVPLFPEHFDDKQRAAVLKDIPLGKEGTPADIGRGVVYLARDATYATGHVLTVDGGMTVGFL